MLDRLPIESPEVLQLAKDLLNAHAAGAAVVAMDNVEDMLQRDDAKGAAQWLAVAHEITRMQSQSVN